jgi:acyl dehydratase
MSGLWFEDIAVGTRQELGRYTFTREAIMAFARRFDPQAFHLDDEAARRSHFGALCASGWHTAAAFMRCCAEHAAAGREEARRAGAPLPEPGPSPGFEKLQWLKPVYVGDTVSYRSEIVSKRRLASRPRWGLVVARNTGVNQAGEAVFSFESKLLVARRQP